MTKPLSEQVAELEKERDRLKADAISDLIKRHWLENQVRNREEERDDLQRQVQEARDENERLRDLVDVLGKHVTIPSEHIRFKGMTDIRYKEPDDDHQDAEVTDWCDPSREPDPADAYPEFGHWLTTDDARAKAGELRRIADEIEGAGDDR